MQDDEILDDDFDIDDDFEDDFDIDGDSDLDSQDTGQPQDSQTPQKKSFLQKFFIPITVAVIAIFGFIFAAGQGIFSGADQQIQPAIETTGIEENAGDLAEKQPAAEVASPIDEITTQPQPEELAPELSAEMNKPLTPLPVDNAEPIELADLNAELQDVSVQDNINEELMDDPFAAPTAELIEENVIVEEEPLLQVEMPDTVTEEDILLVDDIDSLTENIEEQAKEPVNVGIVDALSDEIESDSETISTAEIDMLQEEKATLEKEISEQRAVISQLKAEISSLHQEKQEAEAMVQKIENTEKPALESKSRDVKRTPSKPKPVRVVWELRSAQPGKATLSQKGSNDLKTVEIGTFLSGIGHIQSIQIENGLWVVRGTKGTISQ